jgi:hypothetical protein
MADLHLMALAADPALIPGVYNACDQWCDYCPLTARCLAFRCWPRPDARGGVYHDVPAAMHASMSYLKDCLEAEGLAPPEDLIRLLEDPSEEHLAAAAHSDQLERLAEQYAILATAFLESCEDVPEDIPRRPDGPQPFDVFFWYHGLIVTKIARAIMSAGEASRTGGSAARSDADVSARVAWIAIDRSDQALKVMALDDVDSRIEHMRSHLTHLRRELEARFPTAATLVRPGFDDASGIAGRGR